MYVLLQVSFSMRRTHRRHVALDPTKARPRQFARSSAPTRDNSGSSLWTETPAERQQRLADEVAGRKRRAVNAEPEEDAHDAAKRRRRDEQIRRGVDEHTVCNVHCSSVCHDI
jgi:hypothetical protein